MTSPCTLTLSLIRHAPTIYPQGTVPPVDPDIDLSGHADSLKKLAAILPRDADWWISPLSRCQKTTAALIEVGATPRQRLTNAQLVEQSYGDWHGIPIAEIWTQLKDGAKNNWHFLHPSITPPNGESFDDLRQRLIPLIDEITAPKSAHKDQLHKDQLVVVAHGMVIRGLIGLALGLDSGQSLAVEIAPLSLSQMTYMRDGASSDPKGGGCWQINRLNVSF
jgi:broad specificity phosphatase PhoE